MSFFLIIVSKKTHHLMVCVFRVNCSSWTNRTQFLQHAEDNLLHSEYTQYIMDQNYVIEIWLSMVWETMDFKWAM